MAKKKQILFHGGCHGCTRQETEGTEGCYYCRYFEGDWDRPNLNNAAPNEVDLERQRVKRIIEQGITDNPDKQPSYFEYLCKKLKRNK
jgi:hypothetical protein